MLISLVVYCYVHQKCCIATIDVLGKGALFRTISKASQSTPELASQGRDGFTPVAVPTHVGVARCTSWRVIISQALVDANARDAEDVPLLHWAAINDRRGIVKYLLKQASKSHKADSFDTQARGQKCLPAFLLASVLGIGGDRKSVV